MAITSIEQLREIESWVSRKTLAVCVNVIEETYDVKTFQFKAEKEQLFHFKPGQFIGIQLEVDGEKHNRSYTIASSPTRPHLLELTIKREVGGSVSPWMHKNVKPGTQLELRGPAGRFNCMDIESDKVLLISAGSGVTPMMSMSRFWCDQAIDKDIQFINWARSTQDIIFRRELSLLDHQHSNFNVEVVCTQPGLSENWLGRRGRINKNLLADLVPDLNERTIFCCGPDGFMQQVKTCLEQLDFDMINYHDETFDPGGKKKAKLAAQKIKIEAEANTSIAPLFNLTFAKSGQSVEVSNDKTLLESIEAAGVVIDSACREGNCGSCIVKKVSGETITENESGLDEESKKEGFILTCTTHLKSDVELDL
ncbi:FAD-binding oxidoreductase [Aliikangiella sp. IMCC44359]|uniref:FAD-binding oxidoreductase n=1 Tax=Aliikangiella sp. IMCC44359 TaxID=3459125 RepID=UPI00403B0C46